MGKLVSYHGLVNQGATCYLNSVLQVLFMTEDFRESIKKSDAGNDRALKELFEELEKHDAFTDKITNNLKIKNVHEQRDAAEHFEKILRLTSPEASQIFHGELINSNICWECKDKTETAAGFWSLPLPLVNDNDNEYSVEKGIEDFFRSSVITGDDQMYCEKCDKKCDADLGCEVKDHPEVLVLLLKRFEFDYRYMTYVKINQPVNVPQTLQISEKHLYNLYAVVEHSGELRCGHYVSIIRSQNDGEWYIFNDSRAPHTVLPTLKRSQRAYLLFYRKQKEMLQHNISKCFNQTPEEKQGLTEPNQEDEGTSAKDMRKRRAPLDNEKEKDNKKPKQEPGVDEDLDQRGQKCQDLDNDLSSSNQQMCYFNELGLNGERGNSECTDDDSSNKKEESTEHVEREREPQPEPKQSFASEKTDQPSQMYPNQDHFGTEPIENADSKGGDDDGSEFSPIFPLGFSNQNEQTGKIMQTEITQVQKSGQIESNSEQNLETSENGCDEVQTFSQMCNTDRTIGWPSENVYDKRQGLDAGGDLAEINNGKDENMPKIDSTDDSISSEPNTLSTTWSTDSTAYTKLDKIEMSKLWSLGESSCKNAYEKIEKCSDSDLDCTGDGNSHRDHVEEFSKDSEFICGSEPLPNTQSKERLILVEEDKEKAGSYGKNNVGVDVFQSGYSDINASDKKKDPGYSPYVNQNEVEACFAKLGITKKSELSFEGPQKTGCQTDADSSHMKPKMLTKYDLYLDSIQNLSQTGGSERGKRIIENPPTQSVSGTETECCRDGEYRERFKQERLGDDSCNVQKFENKGQVVVRELQVERCVKTIEEDTETWRITPVKKSVNK